MIRVLHLVWVKKFYERHALLLFFVFYVMFGMVQPGQIISYHKGLIYGMLTSWMFTTIVFGIWSLYIIKTILFLEEYISLPQNSFLRNFSLLPQNRQLFVYAYAVFICYAPVLLYSIFILFHAFSQGWFLQFIVVCFFHVTAIFLSAWRIRSVFNSSRPALIRLPSLRWPFRITFPFFYLALLADRFKIMWLMTKVSSLLLLIGILQIPLDQYEPRLALLGTTLAVFAQANIIFEWKRFDYQFLFFSRTLPIPAIQRYLVVMGAAIMLFLPEIVLLALHRVRVSDIFLSALLFVGFFQFLYSSLYKSDQHMDVFIQRVLWYFLLAFLLVLSKLALPVALAMLAFSAWKYLQRFERHELAENFSQES
jgi:hypothetical protein